MYLKQIFVICIVCVTFIISTGCLSTNVSISEVYDVATEFVRRQLKAPSTAEFSPIEETSIKKMNENTWRVTGYVDSQNSYGAMLRSYWRVETCLNNDEWTPIDIEIL